jgi:hypothetical protein
MRIIKGDDEDSKVNAIKEVRGAQRNDPSTRSKAKRYQHKQVVTGQHPPQAPSNNSAAELCENCGYDAGHGRCPARNARCNYCNNIRYDTIRYDTIILY